jgi:Family of unknown function (DUF5684)
LPAERSINNPQKGVDRMTRELMFAADASQMIMIVIYIVFIVGVIAGLWKAFEKAGKPGWAAIVPIYNVVVMLEIAGKPIWWLLLFFIPCVNIIISIVVSIAVAEAYGKSQAFGIGLALLGFIFWPILGFGDAKYVGPKTAAR